MLKRIIASIFLSLIIIISSVSAVSGPVLVESMSSSLKLQWEPVAGASGYYVYYASKQGTDKAERKQVQEFFEKPEATLTSLDAGHDYYISTSVINAEGQESALSDETMMTTKAGDTNTAKLSLQGVSVINAQTIELSFSTDLQSDASAQREFKIVQVDSLQEVSVVSSSIKNGSTVVAQLGSNLELGKKYNLNVIALQDVNGKSIEAGVDGISNFIVPSQFDTTNTLPELNSGGPEPLLQTTSTGQMQDSSLMKSDHSGNVGQVISQAEMEKTTQITAQTTEKLPKTGPEAIIIVFLSLLFGVGAMYYKRKLS